MNLSVICWDNLVFFWLLHLFCVLYYIFIYSFLITNIFEDFKKKPTKTKEHCRPVWFNLNARRFSLCAWVVPVGMTDCRFVCFSVASVMMQGSAGPVHVCVKATRKEIAPPDLQPCAFAHGCHCSQRDLRNMILEIITEFSNYGLAVTSCITDCTRHILTFLCHISFLIRMLAEVQL